MNIHARIRSIEDPKAFKHFFNVLMSAMHPDSFEIVKDLDDKGVDGYLKKGKTVFAVYCPSYPERTRQEQYRVKVKQDLEKLIKAKDDGQISFEIEEWTFVTPDDLKVETLNFIEVLCKKYDLKWSTLNATKLVQHFLAHPQIHTVFPEISAGIQYDKVPSVYIRFANNRNYMELEVFNNGTEALEELVFETKDETEEWRIRNEEFHYDFENPSKAYPHSCFTLKQGERQYISNVRRAGGFDIRVTGIGVESRKALEYFDTIEPIV